MLGSFVDGVDLSVVIFIRLNIRRHPMRTLAMGYKRVGLEFVILPLERCVAQS